MPTRCSRDLFGSEVVEGGQVMAAFDGGEVTSDASTLLLGATDRTIGLVGRFAACLVDGRAQAQVEHSVQAMVAQRVFGIALGYEDLIDRPAAPRSGAGDPFRASSRLGKRIVRRSPARARSIGSSMRRPSPPATTRSGTTVQRSRDYSSMSSSRRTGRRPDESFSIGMRPAAWPSEKALLSRLLRLLLLPAALCLVRQAPARGQASPRQHRRLCGRGGRSRPADHAVERTHPFATADHPDGASDVVASLR
jgi:hypothetical protein